jgi:hypothetical protein
MSRTRTSLPAFALLFSLLPAADAAAGPHPGLGIAFPPPVAVAQSELEQVDCRKLDISVELGGIFDEVECKHRTKGGYGGESPQFLRSQIVATGNGPELFLMHDHGSSNTYMERRTPRSLFESGFDYDVPGSWKKAAESNDFDIATFFGDFGSGQLPCFAFARYEGHVARSTGNQNRVFGVFCDGDYSSTPLTPARIDEVTRTIKAKFF